MRKTVLALVLLIAALMRGCSGGTAHAEKLSVPTWTKCVYSVQHQVITDAICHAYPMPKHAGQQVVGHRKVSHWTRTRGEVDIIPTFAPAAKPKPALPAGTYQATFWITYYTDSGLMADGNYVHPGAAACSYDLGEVENGASHNARVYVPGVGLLTCEDRIGYRNASLHIDVWDPNGAAHGLGADYRLVTVYP